MTFEFLPGHDLIKTVVLVDHPAITKPVGDFLRSLGYTVHEASNGGQARGFVSRHKPEFIITELLLPLESGFELCAFFKKSECHIPVMILTEVRLEEARNVAMWSGADAFLTKPTDPDRLYRQMIAAAQTVSYRVRAAQNGLAGSISFRCKCGRAIKVGAKNAGKAIICPGCRHLAKCPESMLDSGTLFKSLMEERRGLQSTHAGIVCPHCRKVVDPSLCRVRDHYECTHCSRQIRISADFVEQWQLFFGDQQTAPPVMEFDPLRNVYVQCESCKTLHKYFRDQDHPQACPSCKHQQSLSSIRGLPVSRAALNSTARLFEFRLPDGRTKLFLLPSRGKWLIGSAPDLPLALQNMPILPKHCFLRNKASGPVIHPMSSEAVITVNTVRITEETTLQPGDHIQLGSSVQLILHGTPPKQLKRNLSSVLTDISDRQQATGELQFAESGAKILQYHWELERLRWIEHLKQQRESAASESSLIHHILPEDLHAT